MRRVTKLHNSVLILVLLALSLASCDTDSEAISDTTTQETSDCAVHDGFPVVWPRDYRLNNGTMSFLSSGEKTSWPLSESSFELASAYWALSPNHIYTDIDPDARECVTPDDRWMVVAQPPIWPTRRWNIPFGDPGHFDEAEWESIVAQPWQLDRFGPPGSADQEPSYRGVVKFTDQLAVTSSTCDTRPNVILFREDSLAPMEFPQGEATMVCTPPDGVEPAEGEKTYLPIGGTPSIEDGELVIEYEDIEYWYVPVTEEEFVAAFYRNSFFQIDDPLTVLEDWEAESFAMLDNPSTLGTTGTTKPDDG